MYECPSCGTLLLRQDHDNSKCEFNLLDIVGISSPTPYTELSHIRMQSLNSQDVQFLRDKGVTHIFVNSPQVNILVDLSKPDSEIFYKKSYLVGVTAYKETEHAVLIFPLFNIAFLRKKENFVLGRLVPDKTSFDMLMGHVLFDHYSGDGSWVALNSVGKMIYEEVSYEYEFTASNLQREHVEGYFQATNGRIQPYVNLSFAPFVKEG